MKNLVLLTVFALSSSQAATLYNCSGQGVQAVLDNSNPYGKSQLVVRDLITKRVVSQLQVVADPFVKSNSKIQIEAAFQGKTSAYAVQFVVYKKKPAAGLPPSMLSSAKLSFKNETTQRSYNLSCLPTGGCAPNDPWCGTLPNPGCLPNDPWCALR